MVNRIEKGDIAWIVESKRFIRKVSVVRPTVGICTGK